MQPGPIELEWFLVYHLTPPFVDSFRSPLTKRSYLRAQFLPCYPTDSGSGSSNFENALESARMKAYWYLLPLLFVSYVIAYVDRQNVAIVKLKMAEVMPEFTDTVIGFGAGIFFIGYFLLEVPAH